MNATKYHIPEKLNSLLGCFFLAYHFCMLAIIPLLAHHHSVHWLWLLVPTALLANTHWSLIHEAIHKHFHSERSSNEWWGRMLSICFGVSFHGVQFPHLMHHLLNRDWENERYDPDESWLKQTFNHYIYLLGGLYWFEVASSLLVIALPSKVSQRLVADLKHPKDTLKHQELLNQIERFFGREQRAFKVRMDGVCILLFYSSAFILYGSFGWTLLLMLTVRGFFVSIVDNAYHYGTPADNSISGKELYVPRWLSLYWLNFNHHRTHHNHLNSPWTALPRLSEGYDTQNSFVEAVLLQFKGVIKRPNL